jgi:hypothetical protein
MNSQVVYPRMTRRAVLISPLWGTYLGRSTDQYVGVVDRGSGDRLNLLHSVRSNLRDGFAGARVNSRYMNSTLTIFGSSVTIAVLIRLAASQALAAPPTRPQQTRTTTCGTWSKVNDNWCRDCSTEVCTVNSEGKKTNCYTTSGRTCQAFPPSGLAPSKSNRSPDRKLPPSTKEIEGSLTR